MTLAELIQRGTDIASLRVERSGGTLHLEAASEPMLQSVFYHVTRRAAKHPVYRNAVVKDNTVALVNGAGTLPVTVLVEFMDHAVVRDPADATMANKMRHVTYTEIIRPLEPTLGYFAVNGTNQFVMSRPGTAYSPTAGMTGNITLTTITVPSMPAAPGDAIVAPAEITDDMVVTLAAALVGDWKEVVKEAREG